MAVYQIGQMYWDEDHHVYVGIFIKQGGFICPYTILENDRARNHAGLYAIRQDLIESHESIQYLFDHPDAAPILKKNLLFAAIVQYAKAYTASKNRWAQLDANQVFQGHPAEALDFHNATMELRNQYLAHAGESPHETRVMIALLNPDLHDRKIETIIYNSLKLMNDDANLQSYLNIMGIAINHVENRLQANKAALDLEVNGLGIDAVYQSSKIPTEDGMVIIPNLP